MTFPPTSARHQLLFHHEVLVKSPEELLAEAIAREEADLARRRAERAAMADSGPREIIT